MGLSDIAKAPVSHGVVNPTILRQAQAFAFAFSPSDPCRRPRRGYRASGLVLGRTADTVEICIVKHRKTQFSARRIPNSAHRFVPEISVNVDLADAGSSSLWERVAVHSETRGQTRPRTSRILHLRISRRCSRGVREREKAAWLRPKPPISLLN